MANYKHKEALLAKQNIQNELKSTKVELDDLDKTLEGTTRTFYKEFCEVVEQIDDDPALQNLYKNIYVDTLNQWKQDVHDIEVHIIQLAQWLKNEQNCGFKTRFKRKTSNEDISGRYQVQKPVKRLQCARKRSAKSVATVLSREEERYRNGRRSSSLCFDDSVSLTAVKTNRTLQLRKAETERKKRENCKDPFYIPPQKRKYKKLDNYAKEDVYNRLTRTTTIAYDNQQKLKPAIRSKQMNPSLTTLWSKTGSAKSERNVTFSARLAKQVNNQQNNQHPQTTKFDPKPYLNNPLKTRRDVVKRTRIPRPITIQHGRQRNSPSLGWTQKHHILNQNRHGNQTSKGKILASIGQAVDIRGGNHTSIRGNKLDGNNQEEKVESGKVSVASNWEELSQMFALKTENDDFGDMKSSYVGAQKIYGLPKKKGTFTNFIQRNFGRKINKKIVKTHIKNTKNDTKINLGKAKQNGVKVKQNYQTKVRSEQNRLKGNIQEKVTPINEIKNAAEIYPKRQDARKENHQTNEANLIKQEVKQVITQSKEPEMMAIKPGWKVRPMRYNFVNTKNNRHETNHQNLNVDTNKVIVKDKQVTPEKTLKYSVLPTINSGNKEPSIKGGNKEQTEGHKTTDKNREIIWSSQDSNRAKPSEKAPSQDKQNPELTKQNSKHNQLALLKRMILLEKKPKSAVPSKTAKTGYYKSALLAQYAQFGGKENSVTARKSKSDHSHTPSANISQHNSTKENELPQKPSLALLQRKIFKINSNINKNKPAKQVKMKIKQKLQTKVPSKDSASNGSENKNSDKKRFQNSSNESSKDKTSQSATPQQRGTRSNINQATTSHSNQSPGTRLSASLNNGPTRLSSSLNHNSTISLSESESTKVDAVYSDSQTMTNKARNKPKCKIMRNAFGTEVEELNMNPSENHIFTKFSDNLDAEKAKLAKLDERFLKQKARVESSVKKNHIDMDGMENRSVDTSDDEYLTDTSESEDEAVAIKQTLLLRKKIDERKEAIIQNHPLTKETCQSVDEWPYCHVQGFVDTVINTDTI